MTRKQNYSKHLQALIMGIYLHFAELKFEQMNVM
jgi:hypothetical protein